MTDEKNKFEEWQRFSETQFYQRIFKPYLENRKLQCECVFRTTLNNEFDIIKNNISANTEINFIECLINKIETSAEKADRIIKKNL